MDFRRVPARNGDEIQTGSGSNQWGMEGRGSVAEADVK